MCACLNFFQLFISSLRFFSIKFCFKIWLQTDSSQENQLSQPCPQEAKEFYRKAFAPITTDNHPPANVANVATTDVAKNGSSKDDTSIVDTSMNEIETAEDQSGDADDIVVMVADTSNAEKTNARDDAAKTNASHDAAKSDVGNDAAKVDVASEVAKNDKKRRLPDTDKKLVPMKAPKKPRQDDEDDTSEADSEAVSARKKEFEVAASNPTLAISDSESDAPKKSKPGPKRKKPG